MFLVMAAVASHTHLSIAVTLAPMLPSTVTITVITEALWPDPVLPSGTSVPLEFCVPL